MSMRASYADAENVKEHAIPMHYLLFYEVGEGYVSRRAEFREEHLEKAWQASERGELILGGALADPVDGAVLLFQGDSPEVAERFARTDPYVTHGAVERWHVREWSTVVGRNAAKPVRPHKANVSSASKTLDSTIPARTGNTPHQPGILRMWRARSTVEKLGDYLRHATGKVFPKLRAIEGYRGGYLLRRTIDGTVELVVLTLWESMEAVRRFAGVKPENAVVEPEARRGLTDFDDWVTHFEIVERTEEPAK